MKIVKKYKEFILKQIKSNIYILTSKNRFDIAMHFLRLQESYENSNPKFRRKTFDLLEFIEDYAKNYGKGSFSYAVDFAGFNLTDDVFRAVYKADFALNKYDKRMMEVYHEIQKHNGEGKFTIMGILDGDKDTFRHELAHAYWYLKPSYKREMKKLLKELSMSTKNSIESTLAKHMYRSSVFPDETQAYMSTGLIEGMNASDEEQLKFVEVFNKYNN